MDVDFCTSSELVDELANRSTFAGIIIRSEKEARNNDKPTTIHQKWDITYSRLTAQQVAELLQDAVEHFRQLAEAEE